MPLEQKATSSAGYEFGYCGEYYGTVGFGFDGVFYGLIQVTAEDATQFKGSQIDVVKVAFGEVPTNHNAHIVIFKSIDMYEAAPIYRQAFTPVPNSWTNVALNTPYTLDGEDVFIGYEIRATSNDYPIAVDNSVANSLGDIVGYYEESSDTYFFMHLASSNLGNNCIKLNISGGDLPQYDLALESVAVKQYVQTNTEFSVKGRVKNMAIQTINSFDCTVQIGDSNPIKHTVTIPDGLQNSKTFEFGIDNLIIAQEGETDIKVTISNPNGVADENEADNSIGQTIEALNKLLPRKTLVEDFSSTSYDNSVKVHTFMAELMENNDDIILVRHHPIHSDEFFINASSSYLKFNGGGMTFIPAMMIDRTNLADQGAIGYDMYGSATPAVGPMFSVRNKQSVEEYINYCLDQPSFVSVNIEDSYNPETRELTVRVFGEKVKDLTQAPRINIFITESNLVGYQAGASYNYKHNNIIRATLTNTWGDELKFAEDQYDVTYTYILDGAWKPENMDIVAFVAGYDSGNINNCNVYNTEVKEIEYEYVPTDPTPTASSVQFVYKGE
ncbi:MAG: Omp28-related outer membrane protein, partial [Bacteroidales bacterium]|nr:Omp28-related outer membrane protein [Bacteroidales bacterium]